MTLPPRQLSRLFPIKHDLGVHSQFLTDDIMHLYATGNINNKKKGINEGKMVASMAIGSHNLYEFLNDNPAIDFHPSDYVNDPFIISQTQPDGFNERGANDGPHRAGDR